MIRRLTGRVVDAGMAHIVIDVNGVGYHVATTQAGTNFATECDVTLWTYLAVRETALDLYGFTTRDELEVFELLLTLPKVGPKSALQILSQADIILLKKAVASEDATYLSKMSGIGKKTAEKIVLELKDKFADLGAAETILATTDNSNLDQQHVSDTIDALITLGYPQKDARDAVQRLAEEQPESLNNSNTAITAALRQLGS